MVFPFGCSWVLLSVFLKIIAEAMDKVNDKFDDFEEWVFPIKYE